MQTIAEHPEIMSAAAQVIHGNFNNYNGNNVVTTNIYYPDAPLPAKLHIVPPTSPFFYGREDQLLKITEAFEESRNAMDSLQRTVVLHGFGGMGKSETAKVFARNIYKTYDYIVWIDADTQQSMETSFNDLAQQMKRKFTSLPEDVPELQRNLANSYKKGLFIFDNAERLITKDGQLGLEDFLYTGLLENKPHFLVTSRNGSSHWGGMDLCKLINFDSLSKEEATNMLKNHLRIKESTVIPKTLEGAISLLVKSLGGYPLALQLVGSTIHEKAEEVSFPVMEYRIQAYSELLKNVRDISGESKYEATLEVIYKETMSKIQTKKNGAIAVELLNILACLNPDQLCLGLVSAVYTGTTCEDNQDNQLKNLTVSAGLTILTDCSIVKNEYESGKLKMHRLIQQCARKGMTSIEAMNKICSFFELNENNKYWTGHIRTLMDALSSTTTIKNKDYMLCLLLWRYVLETRNWNDALKKCKPSFHVGTSPESLLFKLAEICSNLLNEPRPPSVNWEEIQVGVYSLPERLTCQLWVTRALLNFLRTCLESKVPLPPFTRETISSFIINRCIEFPTEKLVLLINSELFKTIYGFKSSRSLVQDCTFLRKLFHSPPEECRSNLWSNVWALKSINIEEKNFVRTLFSVCGMDLFALSLKFTRSDMATGFIASNGFDRLLECLCTILEPNRMEHVDFETFREPFLNVFKLWLNLPVSTQNFLAETSVLLKLFAHDKQLYLEFKNQGAEEAFERIILKNVMASRPQNIYSLKHRFDIWHRVTPLLRFLNGLQGSTKWMPSVLLIAELLGLEIQSKEEISNQYTNEMFQIWGVDWFIVSLSFRDDEEKHKWCLRYFGRYLDKLLRVWKTQRNFVKFLTSADFIKILMDVGKSNLEQMSFQVEWDISIYFRLSFVVMCLFDADSNIYDEYHASLSPLFENALNQLFHGIQAKNWNVLEILKESETGSRLKEFELKVQNCKRKSTWDEKFLKRIQEPRRRCDILLTASFNVVVVGVAVVMVVVLMYMQC